MSTFAASLVTVSAVAFAQPAPEALLPSMTLEQALAYAEAHQPSLRAAKARAEAALREAEIPRSRWFPRLGGSAQILEGTANNTTSSYLGSSAFDLPRIGGTPAVQASTAAWKPYPSSLVGMGIRQELFDFGKIAAEEAIFDASAQSMQYRSEVEALNLRLAVKEAYFAVLAAKAILSTAEAAYLRSQEQRDYSAAQVHSGLRSPIDLTRAEADRMRLDAGRIRARGSLTAARGVLAGIVGFPQAQLDTQGEPPDPPPPPAMSSALKKAEEVDPEIRQYEALLRAQQARTRSISMELLPDLSLSSSVSWRNGGAPPSSGPTAATGFLPEVPNWDVGGVLTWQIFDRSVLARRSVSRTYEDAAAAELDAIRLRIGSAIEQAYASTDVARQALPALQRSVEAAKANDAQAQARFRVGLGTSVELADAQAIRTDAEIQLALGQFEYARARARLAREIAEPQ